MLVLGNNFVLSKWVNGVALIEMWALGRSRFGEMIRCRVAILSVKPRELPVEMSRSSWTSTLKPRGRAGWSQDCAQLTKGQMGFEP